MRKFVLINIQDTDRKFIIKVLTICGIPISKDSNLADVSKPVKTLLLNWKDKRYCWADYSQLSWYDDKSIQSFTLFKTF